MKTACFMFFIILGIANTGKAQTAKLTINEINPSITNGYDLIELRVKNGGSVGGFTIEQGLSSAVLLATLPSVYVAAGDIIVIHLNPNQTNNADGPASETTNISQYPNSLYAANYNTAWDFLGGATGLTSTNRVIVLKDSLGNIKDAVPFTNSGTTPTTFTTEVQTIQTQNHWLPSNCGGMPCDYATTPTVQAISVSWLNSGTSRTGNTVQRKSNIDSNKYSDWTSSTVSQTWGLRNSGQTDCISTSSSISPKACYSYTSPSGHYKWTSSDTYKDIIPNKAGCDSNITINLTINQSSFGNNDTSICQGQGYFFNGKTITSAGIYLDTLLNYKGCDSIITLNVTVDTVDISVTKTNTTLTSNATNAIYHWLDCNNNFTPISAATNKAFTPTVNGSYAVQIMHNGCTDTSACFAVTTLGIEKNGFGNAIKVYPNATKGEFYINLGENYSNVTVIIRNISGQEILKKSFTNSDLLQLSIPGEAGLYFIEVNHIDKKTQLKVIKQ